MMNQSRGPATGENVAKGKWNSLKGQIQKAWGAITDDELERTNGDIAKIAGLVQTRYGETQENTRRRINSFLANDQVGTEQERAEEREDVETYTPPDRI